MTCPEKEREREREKEKGRVRGTERERKKKKVDRVTGTSEGGPGGTNSALT